MGLGLSPQPLYFNGDEMAFILTRKGTQITGTPNEALDARNQKIVNVAEPTLDSDVATKQYVDTAAAAASEAEFALDGTFTIRNTADQTKRAQFDVSAVATATTRTIIMPNTNVDLGLIATAIQSSEKGAANGVATLNAAGKLTLSQVPAIAITEVFVVADITARDALTVGPADGEIQTGDVAIVTDASADANVDAGSASYIYDGTDWQLLKSPTSAVTSVNGQSGTVVLDSGDLNNTQAVTANWTVADGSSIKAHLDEVASRLVAIEAYDSDDIAEGSTNLYFTEARVRATVLTGYSSTGTTLADTDTVLGALQKLDAELELKLEAADLVAADVSYNNATSGLTATQVQAAIDEVEGRVDTAETDITALEADTGKSFDMGLAGETFEANQIFIVRRAKNGEDAGRYYKAQADSFINARTVGVVIGTGQAAGDPVKVFKLGEVAIGSSDSTFGAAQIGQVIYLSQTTAGKWTVTPTTASGDLLKEIAIVATVSSIDYVPSTLIIES
jgi:hypothetical protein